MLVNFIAMIFWVCIGIIFAGCKTDIVAKKKDVMVDQQKLFGLDRKTALVTGAGSGLGAAFSEALAMAGARVILSARGIDKIHNVIDNLQAKNLDVTGIEIDISQEESIKNAINMLEARGEKIDILVNNAALGTATPIFQSDPQHDFEQVIKTNLIGGWYMTKAIVDHMKRNKIAGSIINIGSVNGDVYPYKGITAYAVSKAATIHMTRSLVLELSPHKIRINAINLGPTKSHLYGAQFEHDWQFWQGKIPLGFLAEPSDLFGALIYLASSASRFVTGSTITVDGGLSARE